MHELMFQAGVKGMSERTSTYIIIVMLHLSVRLYRVSLYIYIYIYTRNVPVTPAETSTHAGINNCTPQLYPGLCCMHDVGSSVVITF